MSIRSIFSSLQNAFRSAWLYLIMVIAAAALFLIAFNLHSANIFVLFAAGVLFACLVALFVAARRTPQLPPKERVTTTLLSPTVLLNEIRAAALVTYGQIGTVTIKKERAKADPFSVTAPIHDKLFGEELVMDVGVRVVAGVNLKHLREEDIRVNGSSVEIVLPPTKVFMVYVDESLTRVVSHKNGWLTGKDISLMDSARREAMEALVNSAIEKDLFDKAGQQAAAAIASIARTLGFSNVDVHPTFPPIGQHFEELQDPSTIAKIVALPMNDEPKTGLLNGD